MSADTRPVQVAERALDGMAELTAELAAAVHAPGVMVRVLDMGARAKAGLNRGVPTIDLGAEWAAAEKDPQAAVDA
ncbi:hypothetical protein ACWDUI_24275, partial [Streptosporangium sandarakinum]